jgi:hypothetical protein
MLDVTQSLGVTLYFNLKKSSADDSFFLNLPSLSLYFTLIFLCQNQIDFSTKGSALY